MTTEMIAGLTVERREALKLAEQALSEMAAEARATGDPDYARLCKLACEIREVTR